MLCEANGELHFHCLHGCRVLCASVSERCCLHVFWSLVFVAMRNSGGCLGFRILWGRLVLELTELVQRPWRHFVQWFCRRSDCFGCWNLGDLVNSAGQKTYLFCGTKTCTQNWDDCCFNIEILLFSRILVKIAGQKWCRFLYQKTWTRFLENI